jgi:hypothetical protein
MTPIKTRFERISERLAERRATASPRREHDAIMRDPRLAGEHRAQHDHAQSRGRSGCEFCA